ncbi:hypothetical protein ABBQ38_005892 [Trebouxia sp. C0009 RCD-2024]
MTTPSQVPNLSSSKQRTDGGGFSLHSATRQLLFKACLALIERNLLPDMIVRLCIRALSPRRVLNVLDKNMQHQQTGLRSFVGHAQATRDLPEHRASAEFEVCSAAT